MSKKKYRNRQHQTGATPAPDTPRIVDGNGHHSERDETIAQLEQEMAEMAEQGRHGLQLLLDATGQAPSRNLEPLSDEEVSGILADGVRFLHQFVKATSRVLATVDTTQLRGIVAHDLKLPKALQWFFDNAGDSPESKPEPQPEQPADTKPQKRPRGRRHPLMSLFTLSVQAMRLVDRITAKTNPGAHNLPTQKEKLKVESDRAFAKMINSPIDLRM